MGTVFRGEITQRPQPSQQNGLLILLRDEDLLQVVDGVMELPKLLLTRYLNQVLEDYDIVLLV